MTLESEELVEFSRGITSGAARCQGQGGGNAKRADKEILIGGQYREESLCELINAVSGSGRRSSGLTDLREECGESERG